MVSDSYSVPIGDNHGEFNHCYTLYVEAYPDLNDPEKFIATLFYDVLHDDGSEERQEIARVDNRSHGEVHFDRLFEDKNPKDFSIDWDVHEAASHLKRNWKNSKLQRSFCNRRKPTVFGNMRGDTRRIGSANPYYG